MNWTDVGWPIPPWERGVPYDQWRLAATVSMIEHYSARRGQKEEPPKKKSAPKKTAKSVDKFGSLFG
jgi:hypothetical protein